MFDFKAYAERGRQAVDAAMDRSMPPETTRPVVLHRAMRYSVFAGGKRLRPLLCIAACEAVGGVPDQALPAAIALEVLHTYSLIHDDLPCMDDDDLRRGQPASHVVFGQANALLAGDALLTLAFEWLGRCTPRAPWTTADLITDLGQAAGSQGLIGGQVEDLSAEGKTPDPAVVEFIHLHKTAALLRAAVQLGGRMGGGTAAELECLTRFGSQVGLAFQITDDLLNETSTPEMLGKGTKTDRARRKTTYVSVFGIDEARARAAHLLTDSLDLLRDFRGVTDPLAGLARYIVHRKF